MRENGRIGELGERGSAEKSNREGVMKIKGTMMTSGLSKAESFKLIVDRIFEIFANEFILVYLAISADRGISQHIKRILHQLIWHASLLEKISSYDK
jgi:hypothetical protein